MPIAPERSHVRPAFEPPAGCPPLLVSVIADKLTRCPDRIAFYDDTSAGWRAISHRQFFRDANALAHSLAARGVARGDRIGVLSRPCYAWETADKATQLVGGVNVGLDYKSSPSDLAYVVKHAGIRGIVVENESLLTLLPAEVCAELEFVYLVDAPPERAGSRTWLLESELAQFANAGPFAPRARPEDVATILYTSGTTSHPKGIPLTHYQLAMNLPIMSEVFKEELKGEHRTLAWVPLYNGTGRMMSSINYYLDVEQYFVRDPMTLFDKIKPVAPTYLVLMPRITEKIYQAVCARLAQRPAAVRLFVRSLLALRRSLPFAAPALDALMLRKLRQAIWGPRLRFLLSGSAPIDPAILRFFAGMGVETYEVYGLSELSVLVAMNRPGRVRYGSVGEPLPTMDIKLAEDREILVKSPAALARYWRDEQSDLIDAEGYLKTGDLGELRDGYVYIVGRKKEIIKTSTGQRISPVAVENVYRDIPGIEQIMAVGDRRKYLTALISVEEKFKRTLDEQGRDVRRYLEEELAKRHHLLGANRQVKKFAVVPEPFSVENGQMTTTLKLRRAVIQAHYQDLIEAMYQD
jgi:long-chain acyl-CoA synthetase